jgi:uncharacterized membrane protein
MNRAQKIALTTLIASLLGMSLLIIGVVMRSFFESVPKIAIILPGIIMAFGVIILMGCFKKDKGAVTTDERDIMIEKNASMAGLAAVFLLVILVSYVPMAIVPEAKIPISYCPFLLPVAALCYCFAQSLSILIQYGREAKEKNHE